MNFNFINDFIALIMRGGAAITIAIGITAAVVAIVSVLVELRNDRRARDNFTIEARRLTEVNVDIDHAVEVTPVQKIPSTKDGTDETAFAVLKLPMKNIGDGPVDIIGMLVSGRMLSSANKLGIGTRSRDVEWSDYSPFSWNEPQVRQVFSGISTTKHLVTQATTYVRLSAKETLGMRRLDAINNV